MNLNFQPFQPDFECLIKTLRLEKVYRPVLFEFILDLGICQQLAPRHKKSKPGSVEFFKMVIEAFGRLGYDFTPVYTGETGIFSFEKGAHESLASRSQNQGSLISDRATFDKYQWSDPQLGNYEIYERLSDYLPEGMKLLGFSTGGILENATDIVGFENLCRLYLEDPDLTFEVFENIGKRLLDFYSIVSSIDSVGACVVNDDWGFKTQTMFPPEMMQKYIFPYTKKIVQAIHDNGKPAILHSCGNIKHIMDVVIDDLKLDGKHSFEDGIYPVEDAYDWWHNRIAIIGGIDVDFLCRKTPREVFNRSIKMLEKTFDTGGYALGSGNSIPHFVPVENYLAMVRAAAEFNV